jgi:hypothetical protein
MTKHQANPPDTFATLPSPPPWPPYPIPQPPVVSFDAQPDVKMDPWHYASSTVLQDRNATVAKVTLVQRSDYSGPADFEFVATGSSKREQGDKFNARTGELLALSRAYLRLSRDLYAAGKALVEPEPIVPEDNFIGIGAYAAEPDDGGFLEDPTDEDVELAKQILEDRANFVLATRAAEAAEADAAEPGDPDPRVVTAVEAFNGAADALNTAVSFLKTLTD